MDFSQLCIGRASVRAYRPEPVPNEILLQVLKAGGMAPSACNKQPCVFIVITDAALLQAVKESYPRDWFNTAPQIIIVCGDHSISWKRPDDDKDHCDIDVAIAADHITLQAADLGLGTCWICNFDIKKLTETLKLPSHLEPIVMLPIGYPLNPISIGKKRKAPDELYFENGYQKPLSIG